MKTTELYVEQVLIGFLIILIALLPWLPCATTLLDKTSSFGKFATVGSAAVGVAFFLGIPFDRLADTLTQRLSAFQRLTVAFDRAQRKNPAGADPYPEDRLLLTCLRDRPSVVARMDYYRSRIRLSRALAVYGPALGAMAAYGASRSACSGTEWQYPGGVVVAYVLWAMMILLAEDPVRTNDTAFVAKAREGKLVCGSPWKLVPGGRKGISALSIWAAEWRTWSVPIAVICAALIFAAWCRSSHALLAAISGAGLTVVSAWSWWRISMTYSKFLLDADKWRDKRDSP